jgi:hypothetical protein
VKLLGVVYEGKVLAVLELMHNGDLKKWLEKKRLSSDYGSLLTNVSSCYRVLLTTFFLRQLMNLPK